MCPEGSESFRVSPAPLCCPLLHSLYSGYSHSYTDVCHSRLARSHVPSHTPRTPFSHSRSEDTVLKAMHPFTVKVPGEVACPIPQGYKTCIASPSAVLIRPCPSPCPVWPSGRMMT